MQRNSNLRFSDFKAIRYKILTYMNSLSVGDFLDNIVQIYRENNLNIKIQIRSIFRKKSSEHEENYLVPVKKATITHFSHLVS